MHKHADMDIKPINKRASGQAFEVILKPSSPVSDVAHCVTSPPKRDISLDDIQKKLEAAEDRRRVRMFPINYVLHICHLQLQVPRATKSWCKAFCDAKTKTDPKQKERSCFYIGITTRPSLTSNLMFVCLVNCASHSLLELKICHEISSLA